MYCDALALGGIWILPKALKIQVLRSQTPKIQTLRAFKTSKRRPRMNQLILPSALQTQHLPPRSHLYNLCQTRKSRMSGAYLQISDADTLLLMTNLKYSIYYFSLIRYYYRRSIAPSISLPEYKSPKSLNLPAVQLLSALTVHLIISPIIRPLTINLCFTRIQHEHKYND